MKSLYELAFRKTNRRSPPKKTCCKDVSRPYDEQQRKELAELIKKQDK